MLFSRQLVIAAAALTGACLSAHVDANTAGAAPIPIGPAGDSGALAMHPASRDSGAAGAKLDASDASDVSDASDASDASAVSDASDASDGSSDGPGAHDAAAPDAAIDSGTTQVSEALVRMLHRVTPDDDGYIAQANQSDAAAKAWLSAHWQMFEGFSGGPTRAATSWHSGGLLYFDTTAVNTGSDPPDEHILKRPATGERCYNPWGGNPNPQVTWNVTSETTRQYLIDQMRQALESDGWNGLWLDDVNLDIGSSCVGPNDEKWYQDFGDDWPDTWAEGVVRLVEEARAAFPDKTLLQNAPWFSRGPRRWTDPRVMRQLGTASLANREVGVLDDGLTTGTGEWSVKVLFDYVDAVHAAGAGVVWDSFPSNLAEQKYALAAYFIGFADRDFYGDNSARTPATWPKLYDLNLGKPLGARAFDGNARFTRDFEAGTVVLDVSDKTATLPGF